MWKKNKKQPIELKKQISKQEKFEEWINNYAYIFVCIGIFIIAILLLIIFFKIAPGTESGLWYNNRTGMKMVNFNLLKILWNVI